MKVLLLISSCTAREEDILLSYSKVGLQSSIISFQRNMYQGLKETVGNVDVINFYPLGTYPQYCRRIYIKGEKQNNYDRLNLFNVPVIKQLYYNYQARYLIRHWVEKYKDEDKIIFMYDFLRPYLNAISRIKRSKLTTCSIIADLPNEFGYRKNIKGIKAYIIRQIGYKSLRQCKALDYYGLLTRQMSQPLNIPNEKFVVIEGFSDKNRYYTQLAQNDKNIIFYTGALYSVYGINILLDAFSEIRDDSYELWFCGTGDCSMEIKKRAATDHRIKYLGYKSQKEIAILQSNASVLINPRQNIGEYTKYSFPSKIIEYLSTARPIIAYKLDGIPDEYYEYIVTPSDNSVEAMRETIISTCNLPFTVKRDMGLRGREFIIKRTAPKKQFEKLFNLIK